MAHGGSEEWNAAVEEAVAPLRDRVATSIAWGMANPHTLQASLDELSARGVDRVAVVRMFLSGDSFLDQTEWYFGLTDERPRYFVLMHHAASDPGARNPLRHDLRIATHLDGLLDSEEAGRVLRARARSAADPDRRSSVLFLAHGAGDDAEDGRIRARVEEFVAPLREEGFGSVWAETLREDWEEPRAEVEPRLRAWMDGRTAEGDEVIVVPVRLTGFGPYAEVFGEREYRAEAGLLPHAEIATWVARTADRVSCGEGWGPIVADRCRRVVAQPEGPSTSP